MENAKIQTFQDLVAWREGHKLALLIYEITANFPSREAYSLVDQMRRCSVSITSNIAEGFSRKSKKEKMQFYYMALGSTTELQNQLILSRDLKYVNDSQFLESYEQTVRVHKLANGLIKSSRNYT